MFKLYFLLFEVFIEMVKLLILYSVLKVISFYKYLKKILHHQHNASTLHHLLLLMLTLTIHIDYKIRDKCVQVQTNLFLKESPINKYNKTCFSVKNY